MTLCVRTFANEDVALNVDDIVFGETVHRDFSLGVTFVVIDEICGDLLLWAPNEKQFRVLESIRRSGYTIMRQRMGQRLCCFSSG